MTEHRQRSGPLAGLRVLEVGSLIAGPFAGRILADLGSDVVKVEAPGRPDPLREWGQVRYRDRALWWPVQSRNKRLITLDLRQPKGREIFLDLIAHFDALIENFRPGTLERWGLGPDILRERNPGLVVTRVSGYGQDGPYAERAGFASVAEAMGGMRYLNGYPDRPPPRTGLSIGDSIAAMFAVIGTLAALRERDCSPAGDGSRVRVGQDVDVSLIESVLAMLESVIPEYSLTGAVRGPSGTALKGLAPSNIYRTADERWIVIAANQDALFRRLCEAMGQPELAEDERFSTHEARGENQEEIDTIVGKWAARHSAEHIDRVLNEAGVVCGPIYTVADICDDSHIRARGALVEQSDPELGTFQAPGVMPRFSRTPGTVRWSGRWEVGADNADVYGELLDFGPEEIEGLEAMGVI